LLNREISSEDLEKLAADLNATPGVKYAEVDRLMKPLFVPNDQFFSLQWSYYETPGGIGLPAAWDLSTGSGVRVAVLDTGYRPHVDLFPNIVGGYDFISDLFTAQDGNLRDSDAQDPGDFTFPGECGPTGSPSSWHGTHVAGTVAALTNNSTGVAGVAFNARVVPVRVLGTCGGFTSDIAAGLVWAAGGAVPGVPANPNPARVANLSLGGGGACGATMQSAINTARALGTAVVVAAGNSNINAANASPANCQGVIAVAATNRAGGKAFYSNFGAVVDIAAPGGDTSQTASNGIASTLNAGQQLPGGDAYAFYQGTSMASPHVAGVVALIYALRPDLIPDQVETILKQSARPFPAPCSQCGAGIVNPTAALALAASF
jgi:serine protease